MAVLLLCAIALPFSAGTAFATSNITNTTSGQINTNNSHNLVNATNQNSKQTNNTEETTSQPVKSTETNDTQAKTVTQPTTTQANSSSKNIAAGSASATTTTTTQTSFTSTQINSAASSVKTFIETNHRLPNYVTISNHQVTMPQFLQLMVQNLLNYNKGLNIPVTLKTVTTPTNYTETVKSGNIQKSEYLSLAQTIATSIASTGKAPTYVNSPLGKINFNNLVYTFSKILNFQVSNQRLPTYVSVKPWTSIQSSGSEGSSSTIPASLLPYLQPTTNAQSNSQTIIALETSITKGLTTPYDKATAIFNWVRDHITYSFYYNTKYGALGTLSAGTGNCVDHSHLTVALARAAGIPARYQLGYCDFSDGWYGHVWAQLYVNGKWYYADTISNRNTFGVINNWNLNTYTLENTYISLPF
jgi:transglutaminase-like putative cysteine protease